MKRKAAPFLLLLLLSGQSLKAFSQVKISGPECIVPGTEYQYNLNGMPNNESEVDVCIEGGFIAKDNISCYKGRPVNSVRVIWNDNISYGKITITSSSGNGSFNVRPTRVLQGGKVDSLLKLQAVQLSAVPQTINCTMPRGGSCSPSFVYQWEQSDDNLRWANVPGAVFQNLSFSATLNRTVFFRRKVFETISNSIAYSDVAIVTVNTLSGTN